MQWFLVVCRHVKILESVPFTIENTAKQNLMHERNVMLDEGKGAFFTWSNVNSNAFQFNAMHIKLECITSNTKNV